jgi:DNA-binding beta-propeller fold protein YncE
MPTFQHTVTTVPTRVLVANKSRQGYTVINQGTVNVFLGKSREVAVSGFKVGLQINASGGAYYDDKHKGEVWILSASATTVQVTEDVSGEVD